jgi:hypothetical protein
MRKSLQYALLLLLLLAAGILGAVGAVAERHGEQPPIEVYFTVRLMRPIAPPAAVAFQ